jgi:hypothetical protein
MTFARHAPPRLRTMPPVAKVGSMVAAFALAEACWLCLRPHADEAAAVAAFQLPELTQHAELATTVAVCGDRRCLGWDSTGCRVARRLKPQGDCARCP